MDTNSVTDILSGLRITRVYSVNTIYTAKSTCVERRDRECWAIVLKFEGETRYKTRSGEYISNAENMVILPMGSDYDWCCTKEGFYSIIQFESDIRCKEIFSFPIRDNTSYRKIFKELEYKRISADRFYEIECIKGAYSILLGLVNEKNHGYIPSKKSDKINPALDYIAHNYYKDVSNDDLAALCDMSTVYFRKLFTDIMGSSPVNYIHKIRMEKAKEMLGIENTKISDIAMTVGYSSVYHFSKMFKKYVGVSPSSYNGKKDI